MKESSNICDLHGADDVRNCVGYAIQEIRVGSVDWGLAGTELAKAQCNTVPLKLLKIAAQIRITVRKNLGVAVKRAIRTWSFSARYTGI